MARPLIFVLLALVGVTGPTRAAEPLSFRSGPNRIPLVELYTSEGCSSCPAAEDWLARLRNDDGLWKAFVPVEFHVNYWDHLGWRDILATKAYTEREYAYAEGWGSGSVYTPCFVRNGQEWRVHTRSPEEPNSPKAGTLTLDWEPATRRCRIEFSATAVTADKLTLDVSVALLGGGIVSDVRKGENAGRKLRHEFVTLQLESGKLVRATADVEKEKAALVWTGTVTLPERKDIAAERHAIAAWVTPRGKQAPVQAVGGWID